VDFGPGYVFINVVILAALVVVTTRIWVRWPEYRRAILLSVGGSILWSIVWFTGLGSQSLPVELLNPIQEGTTFKNIKHVYGEGAHAGANFGTLLGVYALLDGGVYPSLRMTVGMNIWLGGINLFFMASIARAVLRGWLGAIAVTYSYGVSIVFLQGTLSAGAGQLSSLYLFIGFVLVAAFNLVKEPREFRIVITGLVASFIAVVNTRGEFIAAAVICGGMLFARYILSDERMDKILDAGASRLKELFRRFCPEAKGPWGWGVLAFGIFWGMTHYHFAGPGPNWYGAINPSCARFALYMPLVLSAVVSPAIVLLSVFGVWHSLLRPKQFLLLPIVVIVLFNVYYESSHFGYPGEMTRYLTMCLPLIYILALFGWCELSEMATRLSWSKGLRTGGLLILGIMATPQLDWSRNPSPVGQTLGGASQVRGANMRALLGFGDQQAEIVFLVQLAEDYADCIIAAVTSEYDNSTVWSYVAERFGQEKKILVLMGKPLGNWERHPFEGDPMKSVRVAIAGRAGCVLLYQGLDYRPFLGQNVLATHFNSEGLRIVKTVRVEERHYNIHLPRIDPTWLTVFDLPLDGALLSGEGGLPLPRPLR